MAKKKHKKRSGVGFAVFSVVWAVVLLAATGFGLYWLWGCMEGYEASRPHIAIDKYMSKVTKEYIIDNLLWDEVIYSLAAQNTFTVK